VCEGGANINVNFSKAQLTGELLHLTWTDGMDTPLNRACAKGSLRCVEIMVEELGAQVISTGALSGFSPLHAAAHGGHCNVVRFLIAKGAEVNASIVSGTGQTPSSIDAAEAFLGYTPLMLAVGAKDPWSVNELLLAGASNNVVALNGKTPLVLLQELSATNAWDTVMSTLSSLLEHGAIGLPRPDAAQR